MTEALTGRENSVDGALLLLLAEGKQTLSWSWDKTPATLGAGDGAAGGPRNC